jgi:hypothetical protein
VGTWRRGPLQEHARDMDQLVLVVEKVGALLLRTQPPQCRPDCALGFRRYLPVY